MQLKKNFVKEQDMSNVKITEEGFYKVLVACIKVTTGKWNVKASKRGFHKL